MKMKKGCMFYGVIGLVMFIGIGYYAINKFGPQLLETGKQKIVDLAVENVEGQLTGITDSAAKDSINALLKNYFTDLSTKGLDSLYSEGNKIVEFIKSIAADEGVTSQDLQELKEKLKLNEKQ